MRLEMEDSSGETKARCKTRAYYKMGLLQLPTAPQDDSLELTSLRV